MFANVTPDLSVIRIPDNVSVRLNAETLTTQLLLKLHKDAVPTNLSVAADPPVSHPAKTPIHKPALCNAFRTSVNATKDLFADHLVVSDVKLVETKPSSVLMISFIYENL